MLSKSRLIHHHQCPKRLWLHQFRPDLEKFDSSAMALMENGNRVGEVARAMHPGGVLIDDEDLSQALEATAAALKGRKKPLFEATFAYKGVLVRADLLLPVRGGYSLVEVKSSTKPKPYHLEDVAIQAWVIRHCEIDLRMVEIAHVNPGFVYKGHPHQKSLPQGGERLDCPCQGQYAGLLTRVDVTEEVEDLAREVPKWVRAARRTLKGEMPAISPGEQCHTPFPCPFKDYCSPKAKGYPVELLKDDTLAAELKAAGYSDLRKVPRALITKDRHLRVWEATKRGKAWLDPKAREILEALPYPRYYLDFETIQHPVPIWLGTTPVTQVPFQWSCHIENRHGGLRHEHFLGSGLEDPRRAFAESLIQTVRKRGPIFVYYQPFESARIQELSVLFPDLEATLKSIQARLVDLLPIARKHYFHRDLGGSWSLKAVIPTIAPELAYKDLEITNGNLAAASFDTLINAMRPPEGRRRLRRNRGLITSLRSSLLAYCERDTLALVKLAHHFQSRP